MNLEIIRHDGKLVVDSREVAEMVGKPHNDLMKSIRIYTEYLAAGDFSLNEFFLESTYKDSIGRTLPCYLLTKRGCDLVANKMTGEKGVLFTAVYINTFHEMEQKLAQDTYRIPQTFSEALRLAADLQDKNMLDKPKVEFVDNFVLLCFYLR